PPAKFESEAATYAYIVALLDSAKTNLAAAGGSFPFTIPAGLESFSTPADFLKLNRGLLAKVLIHQATFAACGNPCFTAALTALGESFLTTAGLPGSFTLGAYYAYSTASNEPTNPIAEKLTGGRLYVHPSYEPDAQLTATGAKDLRFTSKVRVGAPKTVTQPGGTLTGTLKPVMYNINTATTSEPDLGADIPWLRNEELILLRAEANIGLGNLAAAVADLDLIRINSGGLPAYAGPVTQPALLDELLYNRRYSLMWEQGTRWLDARRYNRTASLPIDRTGDVIFLNLTVPAGECDARQLPRPCDPLAAGK
ncbi:MAG: RagB/SusD family nutrient uptake outer membrane protein, partial [Gemmatimonadota bacterium]